MYKNTISELVALYALEPELKHLLVEGSTDASFFRWYLDGRELGDVKITAIDKVVVPDEVLEKYGLTSGNRNKAIALALELEDGLRSKGSHAPLQVVVDRDFDDFLGRRIDGKFIEYTDFTSLEMYFFEKEIISKIIKLTTNTPNRCADELMSRIANIGGEWFFVRTANETLDWGMKVSSPVKMLTKKTTSIDLDLKRFVDNVLTQNAKLKSRNELNAEIVRIRLCQHADPRLQVRGHDFVALLHWAIKDDVRPKNSIPNPDSMSQLLRLSSDLASLAKFSMFAKIEAMLA